MEKNARDYSALRRELEALGGVDCARAMARLAGNQTLYFELIQLFFEEDLLGRLCAAMEKEDVGTAELEAHNLKGTAANLGFNSLSSSAAQAERLLRAGELSAAADALGRIEKEYEELRARAL